MCIAFVFGSTLAAIRGKLKRYVKETKYDIRTETVNRRVFIN